MPAYLLPDSHIANFAGRQVRSEALEPTFYYPTFAVGAVPAVTDAFPASLLLPPSAWGRNRRRMKHTLCLSGHAFPVLLIPQTFSRIYLFYPYIPLYTPAPYPTCVIVACPSYQITPGLPAVAPTVVPYHLVIVVMPAC